MVLAVAHRLIGTDVLRVGPVSRSDAALEGILLLDQIFLGGVGDWHEASVDCHSGIVRRGRDVVVLVVEKSVFGLRQRK